MNVLVIHPTPRPFIDLDVEILRSAFAVRTVHVRFHPRHCFVADTMLAMYHTAWADVVLAWFGGLHALAPFVAARLLGKRCAVIASGVDVAARPSIEYGHMRPGWLRAVGRLVFRMAHRVFAVSTFTAQEAAQNAGVPPARIDIIPHGLSPCSHSSSHERRGVITVATANAQTLRVKGLITFVRAAAWLPDTPFELIGGGDAAALRELRRHAPPNVAFTVWLAPQDLQARMAQSAVYAQLSAYESFGIALAEAMRCGCIPITTRRGALPEVVGDTGLYVPYGDPEATAQAIRHALDAPADASSAARERIATRFPLSQRRDTLIHAVRTLGLH
jgi:glycosyltransferase involved in cell wall biosynthesis